MYDLIITQPYQPYNAMRIINLNLSFLFLNIYTLSVFSLTSLMYITISLWIVIKWLEVMVRSNKY